MPCYKIFFLQRRHQDPAFVNTVKKLTGCCRKRRNLTIVYSFNLSACLFQLLLQLSVLLICTSLFHAMPYDFFRKHDQDPALKLSAAWPQKSQEENVPGIADTSLWKQGDIKNKRMEYHLEDSDWVLVFCTFGLIFC